MVYLVCVDKALIKIWNDADGIKCPREQLNSHYILGLTWAAPLTIGSVASFFSLHPFSFSFFFRCLQTEDEEILKSMKSCVNETLTTIAQYFGQLIELVLTYEAQVRL